MSDSFDAGAHITAADARGLVRAKADIDVNEYMPNIYRRIRNEAEAGETSVVFTSPEVPQPWKATQDKPSVAGTIAKALRSRGFTVKATMGGGHVQTPSTFTVSWPLA